MHKLVYRSALAVASVAALVLIPAAVAAADTARGIDVSWPQCAQSAPSDYSFVIVGLNHGKANNDNECRNSQLALAAGANGTAAKPQPSVYVNTGNPGLAGSWWPSSNTTQRGVAISNPHGTCAHTASAACSYVYGYSMASDDVTGARDSSPIANPTSYFWWMDVETGNTWSGTTANNAADIHGMLDSFQSLGIQTGVYSTPTQWKAIAGTTSSSSSIAGLPTWLAGSTASGAPKACTSVGLTPGSVVTLVQYVSGGQDFDFYCAPMAEGFPSISGSAIVGKTLTGRAGTWPSGASLKDHWNRNGVPIKGATTHLYKLTSADVGKSITMSTTATQSGFQTTTTTSSAVYVNRKFTTTPVPTLSGTTAVGHVLKATIHAWSPKPSFSYQWKRDKVAIAGATGTSYALTSADKGKSITFSVTASKVGYTTVVKTSAARTVRAA